MKDTKLYIFDGQTDQQLAILSLKNNKQLSYMEDEIIEQLNKDFTFDFTVPMNHKDSQYLTDGNRIVFQDKDGEFQEFQIYKSEEERSGGESVVRVQAEHSIYEINDDIVEDLRVVDGDVSVAMDKGLSASRYEVGIVDPLGIGTVNFYYSNGMKNLKDIQREYGGEFKYRVTLNADKTAIEGRFVDLLARRGSDTNKRYEYKKDIRTLKRSITRDGIKTALYGRGKGEETGDNGYSRKMTFKNVEWSKANGDPLDKPLGQEWIGDPDAKAQFGRQGRHRFDTWDVDSVDPLVIIQETYEQLMKINSPRYTIEVEGQDLEIVGLVHEKVRLGDTVFIIDKTFKPELRIEARVIEIRRSLSNPENIKVVLGNFLPLSTDIAVEVEDLKADFTDRKGVWDTVEQIDPIVNDGSVEDILPNVPTNFEATGLFKSIAVEWDFDPSLYIASYEVYASKVQGFTVDSSNLVFRGKSGGYVHKADTNETWYFRIRAVNTHDRKSQLSAEINASTIRIETADYEDLSIVNSKIANLSVDASKMAKATITDAEIKSLNVDKVVAGRLKAQFVEIGSTTVYESTNYDPSSKATPSDVSTAETNAKAHADTVSQTAEDNAVAVANTKATPTDVSNAEQRAKDVANTKATPTDVTDAETRAKSHADTVSQTAEDNAVAVANTKATPTDVSDAEARAKTHADQVAEAKRVLAEENANAYADGVVSDEEQARIDQAQANLTTAKNHADNVSSTAESNAKGYADTKKTEAITSSNSYADTKKTEAITSANSYADTKKTEAITSANSYADTKKSEAISSANGYTDGEVGAVKDSVEPSLRNVYDPKFIFGKRFWSDSYEGIDLTPTTQGTEVATTESVEGGKLIRVTGQMWAYALNPIPVNTSHVYQVTFRMRQTVDPTTANTSKVYAGVTTLDKDFNNITGGAGSHRYCAVGGTEILVEDGWQTFTGTITGEGDLKDQFRPDTKYVRPMFIVNYSGGDGEAEVDLLDFEDVTQIQELVKTVDEVALRTEEDKIIQTVRNSQEYSSDLLEKANSKALEGYATTDDLGQAKTDLSSEMDTKIGDIDFSPYATQTDLTTTADGLDAKFSSSGGVNLLKNSVGFAGTDFWEVGITEDEFGNPIGNINTRQGGTVAEKGSGSAFVLQGSTLTQSFNIATENLTLSAVVKKPAGVYGYIQISYDNGQVEKRGFGSTADYDYEKIQLNISPTSNSFTVEMHGDVEDEVIITSLMVNVGNVPLQWQHSSGEVYNTNVLMDLNGIKVISNQYNGYTSITPEEFSGYAEVEGEMKRVFTLNKDTTEMSKVDVEKEISMTPIKIVPVTGTYNGWAFIGEK